MLRERARRALDLTLESADRAVGREDGLVAAAFLATVGSAAEALGDALTSADRIRLRLLEGQVARAPARLPDGASRARGRPPNSAEAAGDNDARRAQRGAAWPR